MALALVEVALLKRLPRLAHVFDYHVSGPAGRPALGSLVQCDFRGRSSLGIVVNYPKRAPAVKEPKLLGEVLVDQLVTPSQLQLSWRMAQHYGVAWGQVLQLMVPVVPTRSFKVTALGDNLLNSNKAVAKVSQAPMALAINESKAWAQTLLQLVRKVRARGEQVLVLAPDLSQVQVLEQILGPEFQIHKYWAQLSVSLRQHVWSEVRSGKAGIVVGTRSALFLPYAKLGGIVVSEAHSEGYKQVDQNPRYDAREVSEWLAQSSGASLAFVSVAPLLEHWHKSEAQGWGWQEVGKPERGKLQLMDWNASLREPLCPEVTAGVSSTLAHNGRVLCYLNRRGEATSVRCGDCGYVPSCAVCERPLVSTGKGELACFQCKSIALALPCARCKGMNVREQGLGVRSLARILTKALPNARVGVVEGGKTQALSLEQANLVIGGTGVLSQVWGGEYELAVMISPDNDLALTDYRTAEEVWSVANYLLSYIPSLLIQTRQPEYRVWQSLKQNNRKVFYTTELEQRRQFGYPPAMNLLRLTLQAKDREQVLAQSQKLASTLSAKAKVASVTVTGPYPDYYHQVRGRYRFHLLLRYGSDFNPECLWPFLPVETIIDRHPWDVLS